MKLNKFSFLPAQFMRIELLHNSYGQLKLYSSFIIIRTDHNTLLSYDSDKYISYHVQTIIRKVIVEQAAKDSKISMHRLNIDSIEIQKEFTKKIIGGKFNEISRILNSYVERVCPGREAGKLSSKKFDKFMLEFNSRLNVVLNQSIEQILHNRDGRLEVDGAKQMSLEPQSYLSNASVHSHSEVSTCLSEIGVTKLGGNLNR